MLAKPVVVISQPMLFPWVGMLEQMRLADVYVHYDDVQFSKGGFINRVQIKTAGGSKWMTIPVRDLRLGAAIDEVRTDEARGYRRSHVSLLEQAFTGAPHADDALALVERVYATDSDRLVDLLVAGLDELTAYFDVRPRRILRSSAMGIDGKSTERVVAVVAAVEGRTYVTGHGARHYLGHDRFEARGIAVEYMDYRKTPYPQLHGPFTPFVSALDLIANVGKRGRDVVTSGTTPWKDFVQS